MRGLGSLILVLVLLGVFVYAVPEFFPEDQYVEAEIFEVFGNTLTVGNGCKAIVADTSPERAIAIQLGLAGEIDERPTIYDNYAQTLENFNITLESVALEGFHTTYYAANMIFRDKDRILKIDAKPSDAFALALRTNSTIYINKTLLEEIGVAIC